MASKLEVAVDAVRVLDEKDLRKILEFTMRQIKMHKEMAASALMASLKKGDRVRVSDRIKPRYMAGQEGTVLRVLNTRIEVEFDQASGRFGKLVRVPASALEKLEEK